MGNPASVIRKATEKRRKKYETRLGAGAYLPKAQRLAVNAEVAKLDAAAKVEAEKQKKAREAKKKAKKAAPKAAAPTPAAKDEKK